MGEDWEGLADGTRDGFVGSVGELSGAVGWEEDPPPCDHVTTLARPSASLAATRIPSVKDGPKAKKRNLQGGKAGLASSPALGERARQAEAGRKAELHVSVATAVALATAADLEKPGTVPANPPLSMAALTVAEDRLGCECWLPVPELKVLVKSAR